MLRFIKNHNTQFGYVVAPGKSVWPVETPWSHTGVVVLRVERKGHTELRIVTNPSGHVAGLI